MATVDVDLYVVSAVAIPDRRAKSSPPSSPSSSSIPVNVYEPDCVAEAKGKRKMRAQVPVYGASEGTSKLKRVVFVEVI